MSATSISGPDPSLTPPSAGRLIREDRDGIAVLTLNRPRQFNAYDMEMLAELHHAIDAIGPDPAIRVVVITGAGSAFCAGCDLKEMRADYRHEFVSALFDSCRNMMIKLQRLPQPVVAAVNGIATAAGCELVAQCDLAVAADNARFAVSGINFGLYCSTPAVPLSRNIARKRAFEMLATGEFIDAPTALDWGLVNRIAPADRLLESTFELANTLMAKPREVLALGKALFYRQLEAGLASAYDDAWRTISSNMMEPVAAEGVDAFIEKRRPNWKT